MEKGIISKNYKELSNSRKIYKKGNVILRNCKKYTAVWSFC